MRLTTFKRFGYSVIWPVAFLLFLSAFAGCTSDAEKMDAITAKGHVVYNGKDFPVDKVDRENQVVYIKNPDGVVQTVPLIEVKPAE